MRSRVIVLVSLVVILFIGTVAAQEHHQYVQDQEATARRVVQEEQRKRDEAIAAQLAQKRAKCIADTEAYNKLTPAAKAKAVKPDVCFVQTVQ